MTDDRNPAPSELDELASAALDHEATADELARVAAEPELASRVERFRGIAERVADVEPLTESQRERLVSGALSATANAAGSKAGSDAPAATPISLTEHRARRNRLRDTIPWSAAAVVAVVILLLGVPALLISLNRDSGVNDMASSSADQSSSLDKGTETAAAEALDPTTTTLPSRTGQTDLEPAPPTVALGSVASPTQLEASVRQQLVAAPADPSDPSSTTSYSPPSTLADGGDVALQAFTGTCEEPLRTAHPELGSLVIGGTVDYQGVPSHVYAFQDDPAGPVTVVVADPDTCSVVAQTTVDDD